MDMRDQSQVVSRNIKYINRANFIDSWECISQFAKIPKVVLLDDPIPRIKRASLLRVLCLSLPNPFLGNNVHTKSLSADSTTKLTVQV